MFYRFGRILCAIWIWIFYRPKVEGKRWLRPEGKAIVVCNHNAMKDIVVLGVLFHPTLHFLAKEELFKNGFLKRLFTALQGISLRRGEADLTAMRAALRVLKNDEVLAIFPEGTRSKDTNLQPFESGASLLAIKGKAPVIPVAIYPRYSLWRRLRVCVGQPMDCAAMVQGMKNQEAMDTITGVLHHRVQSMLESMREQVEKGV